MNIGVVYPTKQLYNHDTRTTLAKDPYTGRDTTTSVPGRETRCDPLSGLGSHHRGVRMRREKVGRKKNGAILKLNLENKDSKIPNNFSLQDPNSA